jgi:hypothetical protein
MNGPFRQGSAIFRHICANDQTRSQTQGENMTTINSTHKFSAAAAIGAAALFSLLSMGNTAQASSVTSCHGTTLNKVVDCCEQLVKKNGRPLWMLTTGTSCKAAAVCRGGHGGPLAIAAVAPSPRRCYVHIVEIVKEGGGEEGGGNDGPNTPR